MMIRKPPVLPTPESDDLLADPDPSELDFQEDGLVLPLIPEDPERNRTVDPQD